MHVSCRVARSPHLAQHQTHLFLLIDSILISNQVHIEVLHKGVVTACFVTDDSQQVKQRLHLISVVADIVQVAFGNAPGFKQLRAR